MTSVQFILLIVVAAIAGMGSVLDEAQFHRPLVACTLVGLVLGDMTTGIILGGTPTKHSSIVRWLPARWLVLF